MPNTKTSEVILAMNSALPKARAELDNSPWRQRFMSIYSTLRERITMLKLVPGVRLDIDALANEFNVSRTPVRTVLQRLEHEGLAITRHGVGTMVTEIDIEHVRRTMQLRIHLAELIGTLSPNRPDEGIFDLLEGLRKECSTISESSSPEDPAPESFVSVDIRLHACKCQLIGNEVLRGIYDELYHRTKRLWFSLIPQMDQSVEFNMVVEDVNQTLSALRRGDVAAVGFITRNSISTGLFRLDALLQDIDTDIAKSGSD
jgi:DNA-binding GntR family transcriptional regulator